MLKKIGKIGQSLTRLLAKNGAVRGPYYGKGFWMVKTELRSYRDNLCGADERARLDPRYSHDVSIADMNRLSAFIDG